MTKVAEIFVSRQGSFVKVKRMDTQLETRNKKSDKIKNPADAE